MSAGDAKSGGTVDGGRGGGGEPRDGTEAAAESFEWWRKGLGKRTTRAMMGLMG